MILWEKATVHSVLLPVPERNNHGEHFWNRSRHHCRYSTWLPRFFIFVLWVGVLRWETLFSVISYQKDRQEQSNSVYRQRTRHYSPKLFPPAQTRLLLLSLLLFLFSFPVSSISTWVLQAICASYILYRISCFPRPHPDVEDVEGTQMADLEHIWVLKAQRSICQSCSFRATHNQQIPFPIINDDDCSARGLRADYSADSPILDCQLREQSRCVVQPSGTYDSTTDRPDVQYQHHDPTTELRTTHDGSRSIRI